MKQYIHNNYHTQALTYTAIKGICTYQQLVTDTCSNERVETILKIHISSVTIKHVKILSFLQQSPKTKTVRSCCSRQTNKAGRRAKRKDNLTNMNLYHLKLTNENA